MKTPSAIPILFYTLALILTLLRPGWLYAQDQGLSKQPPPALPAIPAAVMRAPVISELTAKGEGADGGDLIIQRIRKPVPTAQEMAAALAAAAPPAALPPGQQAEALRAWRASRASHPREIRLFSPRITPFPDGICLVQWWSTSAEGGLESAEAWLRTSADLAGTITAAGDLDVSLPEGGFRRYLLMPAVLSGKAAERQTAERRPPAAEAFATGGGVVMEREVVPDPAMMEPVHALLAAYQDPERSARITADAAALQAVREAADAAAAWDAAHPQPPAPSILKIYTSDEDETSTLEKAAPALPPLLPIR